MAYKVILDPFTGELQLINQNVAGSGVMGIPPTTIGAIAQWADTTATTIADSPGTLIQNGSTIQAQEFIFDRYIETNITVPNGYTMIGADMVIDAGSITLLGTGQILLL